MPLKISYYVQGRHVMEHLTDDDNRLITVRPIALCCGEGDAQTIVTALEVAQGEDGIETFRNV